MPKDTQQVRTHPKPITVVLGQKTFLDFLLSRERRLQMILLYLASGNVRAIRTGIMAHPASG